VGPIRCPETSVNNYLTTPRNIPEERRSHQHNGGSLKSKILPAFKEPCSETSANAPHPGYRRRTQLQRDFFSQEAKGANPCLMTVNSTKAKAKWNLHGKKNTAFHKYNAHHKCDTTK
jgi:hypothetical protein